MSDKNLTQQSGFFEYIEPGDTILADRGFTIADDIAVHGGKLEIPAFTRGKSQLSQREVEVSKQLDDSDSCRTSPKEQIHHSQGTTAG